MSSQHELNKNDTNEHSKQERKESTRLQTYTKKYGQLRKAGSVGDGHSREEYTNSFVQYHMVSH